MNADVATCTLLDGETIRILITALTGLLGTLLGGLLNYCMTKGQMKKELELEKLKYENERENKNDEIKEASLQEKKELYSEYVNIAMRYATQKDNIADLRKITLEVVLVSSKEVSEAVSAYYTDINDEINKDLEFAMVMHDKHINNIINAIRKDIYKESDKVYVHLVDDDK